MNLPKLRMANTNERKRKCIQFIFKTNRSQSCDQRTSLLTTHQDIKGFEQNKKTFLFANKPPSPSVFALDVIICIPTILSCGAEHDYLWRRLPKIPRGCFRHAHPRPQVWLQSYRLASSPAHGPSVPRSPPRICQQLVPTNPHLLFHRHRRPVVLVALPAEL